MRAIAISPLLRGLLKDGGELCGVFSGALGIRCGSLAVMLQSENVAASCAAAVSGLPAGGAGCRVGARVSLRGDSILLGDATQIDLAGAEIWGGMTVEPLSPMTPARLAQALETVKNCLLRHRREDGFSLLLGGLGWDENEPACPAFYNRALRAILLLRRAVASGNPEQAAEAQKNLVGFGAGLTPSGDDFLTGFWAAVLMLSGNRAAAVSHAINRLADPAARTTIYGYSELWALQKGYCGEPVCSAIRALAEGVHADEALGRLASFGGTTGADTVLGIAEALLTLAV
ncbi:MAG: DUF2877 domain-containing protein [Oscillospiraceae bacterium]|nr:DUF2877 domain-containing protein [Oscillospiraceae bacterium]